MRPLSSQTGGSESSVQGNAFVRVRVCRTHDPPRDKAGVGAALPAEKEMTPFPRKEEARISFIPSACQQTGQHCQGMSEMMSAEGKQGPTTTRE
jgi:hypothetical protein